jgi:hypothetical protein
VQQRNNPSRLPPLGQVKPKISQMKMKPSTNAGQKKALAKGNQAPSALTKGDKAKASREIYERVHVCCYASYRLPTFNFI